MKICKYTDPDFAAVVQTLINRSDMDFMSQDKVVRDILEKVKKDGDAALLEFTHRFDHHDMPLARLRVTAEEIKQAYQEVKAEEVEALKLAAANIRDYHQRQAQESWEYRQDEVLLGQIIRPLAIVGLYVPGGKASYPSSVLMNAIPAKVAGVERVIMCSPAPKGQFSPHTLVAADIAGVTEIYKVGGAQAVGAMAFGTVTIPRVDKIVGPGNIYVALAKRLVFGQVDIDMIAGPSEILIVADDTARPDFVAADLLSQAEHDEKAVPILVTVSEKLAKAVQEELETQKKRLKREAIVDECLNNQCRLLVVASIEDAIDLANQIAAEHLELAMEDAESWVKRIRNAGAIFLGHYTPEALGDYIAGPNHVLPTSGTARFSSPLGVYDFLKRTSLIGYTQRALKKTGKSVTVLAEMEHLEAHAKAVKIRLI